MNQETLENSSKTYLGIQKVGITSAHYLLYPEEAFAVSDALGIGLEVYPTMPPKILQLARLMGEKLNLPLLPPPGLDAGYVQKLQDKFPYAKVDRVHLEFNYNWYESLHRIFIGERKNGPKHMAFQVAWAFLFKPANALHGLRLAKSLGVGVNAHTNVLEGFYQDRLLSNFEGIYPILAENERAFESPILPEVLRIANPIAIADDFVEKRKLADGILLGLDHRSEPLEKLIQTIRHPLIRQHTQALHLADPGRGVHGVITVEDEDIHQLLRAIAETEFTHPVTAYLNFVTKYRRNGSLDKQVEYFKRLTDWIMSTQIHVNVSTQ